MLKKKLAFGLMLGAVAVVSSAEAGKPERDKQKELQPLVAQTTADVKAACGCNVAIAVAWDSYKKVDDMGRIGSALEALTESAKENCGPAEEKKIFCQTVKTYSVSFSQAPDSKLTGSTLWCGSNDSSYCGSHLVTKAGFSGKARRDKIREVSPKIAATRRAVKAKCGCNVDVGVKFETYPDADSVWRVADALSSMAEAAEAHCSDAVEKKAFCENVSSYSVSFSQNPDAKLAGKTITCGSNGSSYCGAHLIKPILDKF